MLLLLTAAAGLQVLFRRPSVASPGAPPLESARSLSAELPTSSIYRLSAAVVRDGSADPSRTARKTSLGRYAGDVSLVVNVASE